MEKDKDWVLAHTELRGQDYQKILSEEERGIYTQIISLSPYDNNPLEIKIVKELHLHPLNTYE
jgi:hypothetical protein